MTVALFTKKLFRKKNVQSTKMSYFLNSFNENIDYQSDDDSIGTLINSPTNSSVSSSSIPWAEENIADNRSEWNKIERIFYGEEELPTEPKTRNEFLEWMELFPHLRVVGKKVPIYYDPSAKEENFVNEILAIDPPIERYNSRSKSSSRKTNTEEIYFSRKSSKSKEDNLSSDLNKFLKISRSPVMTRRQHLSNSQKSNETKVPYFVVPSSSYGKTTLLNRRKFITSISSSEIVPEKDSRFPQNTSLSASMIRMPQILNFKILNRVPQISVKSAVYGVDGNRNRNRTILPSIELKPSTSSTSKRSVGILKN